MTDTLGVAILVKHVYFLFIYLFNISSAQPDARPIGDQEVVGSIPARSDIILLWRLIIKKFLRSFSPSR